ncbi:MAG: hypothetical protein HC866_12530 [Leptolyngbyaceae cyanobacterium RU_5_1]|nr:hypothetical protein [Leptolyngbyaceae cyanobacterium RU_5_1]
MNKRLIQPLDPAFEVAKVDVTGPTTEKISSHHSVLLAALGIREADLVVFKGLTNVAGAPYITDDLTLTNLSFLWRHAWLSKLLKFKVEDWKLVPKLFHQDIMQFANPQVAWDLIEKIDQLKAAGFTPDELNWLLASDLTSKAATKETDAIRFLSALRKELQAIKAEYSQTPPADADGLTALLTSLLQKLKHDEAAIQLLIATLRDEVSLSALQVYPQASTFQPRSKRPFLSPMMNRLKHFGLGD